MPRWLKRPTSVVAALVALGLCTGVAWAAIPDGSGTITACYSSSDKSLRVVDSGCAAGEKQVTWSQSGVQGAAGPPGPQGPQGSAGAQGPAGLTLATVVAAQVSTDPQIGGFFKELTCPSGTKALGGSWQWVVFKGDMPPADVESFPVGDDSWGFAVGASSQSAGLAILVGLSCVNSS
ncbi:MAG TPA: hypothetical protein VLB89_05345 [Gaiellaceae bacterium]|nr:hypothetical protein [Gaiellaceae bacterium]